MSDSKCRWRYDGPPHCKWDTQCGTGFQINGDGNTPQELGYEYCPNCGSRIENITGTEMGLTNEN
jgi:hypothetical protein